MDAAGDAALLERVVAAVRDVPGIIGVVLGGSRANGTHVPESDYDLGLFYRGDAGFDLAALERVARALDDEQRADLVTPIGGWGPWVVGGGWLKIGGRAVDFNYRDAERVRRVIDDCRNGIVEVAYQPAYVVGYVSTTYMAEVDACRVLWDPTGELAALKALTRPYPDALREAMLGKFGWVPDFAITAGRKGASRADVTFASGAVYWTVMALVDMIFALNGEYRLSEKGVVARVESFPRCPRDFRERVERIYETLRADERAIRGAFDALEGLAKDVERLRSVGT
jgi:predicted nucleotidyltransferase